MSNTNQSTNKPQENDKKSEVWYSLRPVDPIRSAIQELHERVEALEKMHKRIYCGCIDHTHCGSMGCR